MTATKTKSLSPRDALTKLGACSEARAWVGKRTAQQAWDECEDPDWLFWLIEHTMPAKTTLAVRRRIVRLACDCARRSLQYVPAGEDRPRVAIETAERWAKGEPVTVEEINAAGYAAWAAAGDAAWAAARAAAGDAAGAAAGDAARAAARAAAGDAEPKEQCRIIRKWFPKCPTMPKDADN